MQALLVLGPEPTDEPLMLNRFDILYNVELSRLCLSPNATCALAPSLCLVFGFWIPSLDRTWRCAILINIQYRHHAFESRLARAILGQSRSIHFQYWFRLLELRHQPDRHRHNAGVDQAANFASWFA